MAGSEEKQEKMQAATLDQDIEEFLSNGGEIQKLPPQKADPRRLQTSTPVRMVVPRLSPWQEETLDKAEALLYRLNISGNDPLAVRGTQVSKLTTFDVWAALVSVRLEGLSDHPTWRQYDQRKLRLLVVELQIYKHALTADGRHDQKAHRVLYAELLFLLLDRKVSQSLDVRKSGILERMVLAAIRQVCDPAAFNDHRSREQGSARDWAGRLGLSDHKDWIQRWQFRYFDFLNDLTALDVFARDEIIKRI